MLNKLELKKEDIDFTYLFKIMKIDEYKVTFKKYGARRVMSDREGYELIELTEDMGEEIYTCSPEVILKLVGRVGSVIKRFRCEMVGEKGNKVKVAEIYFL